MTTYLVLADFKDSERSMTAGSLVESAQLPIAQLTASGLALITWNPSWAPIRTAFLSQRANGDPAADLVALLLATVSGGGGGPIPATSVTYDDTLVSPPLGATEVQGALDEVKVELVAITDAIVDLDGRLDTAEGAITTLTGDVSSLSATVSAIPTLAGGTYAPTLTGVNPVGIAPTAVTDFKYHRIGNVVFVSGLCSVVTPALNPDSSFDMTLPIATASPETIAGNAAGTSEPASGDLRFVMGPIENASGAARANFALNLSNAPGTFRLGVTFSYVVS